MSLFNRLSAKCSRYVLLCFLGLSVLLTARAEASTRRYRLSWRDDPSTTMIVAWERYNASGGTVYYGPVDHGTSYSAYPSARGIDRTTTAFGMTHCFSRLTGLQPDTVYYFVIVDSNSTSARYSFRTAPSSPSSFSFIAGGDSRNNRTPRQRANELVSKLRPLFVAFGGDYTDDNTSIQWQEWLDDWQRTISPDGRMYPILAARGNHDDDAGLNNLFDWPNTSGYFAQTFGGSQLRTYTLNSEISAGGSQRSWLTSDLAGPGQAVSFRVAQYHKPMRPHTSGKSEGNDEYNNWAQVFYDHRMDLVVECDSHMVKRTYPIRPSTGSGSDEGFVRSDSDGTTYIGEGCWGAPLRTANDAKNWTRALGSFNQINWVHVRQDRMEVRTIEVDQSTGAGSVSDSNLLAVPSGLSIWSTTLSLPARGSGPVNVPPTANAGPDQTLTEASGAGGVDATLDGRASTDSDGSITSYVWTEGATQVATGSRPTVWLSVGTHTLTLTVTDDDGAVDTDTVRITVNAAAGNPPAIVSFTFEQPEGWANPDGSYGWRRDSGGTPSSGTGPASGEGGSAYYWYMETSSNQGPYDSADPDSTVVSPLIADGSSRSLEFYYHMYGGSIGRLHAEVSINNGATWTTVVTIAGQQQTAHTSPYQRASADLSSFVGPLRVRFRGESTASSNGWQNDMAVDTVTIYGFLAPPVPPIATFDFEGDAQGWTNPDGTYGWRHDSGGTPSSGTGPTLGNSGAYYLYMETSNNQGPIDTSRPDSTIVSPVIPVASNRTLEFYYHMYGARMGTLYAEVSTDGGSTYTPVWSISGQQHASQSAPYTRATADLSAFSGALLIRFRGAATASSNGWTGDMAVDDVSVYGN